MCFTTFWSRSVHPNYADMAGRRVLYLAALAGCLAFYCFYREWFSWFALVLLLGLPWFSLICSLPGICTAKCAVVCPQSTCLEQHCRAILTATCPLPAPPFRGKLRLTHAITGETKTVPSGSFLPTQVCGQVRIEAVRPRIYDYLGLFRLSMKQDVPVAMTVFPLPVAMENVPDFARRTPRQWKPRPGGGFSEQHELRLYRPGDNLQQIHWKLSAKTGKLIFREAMEPVRHRIVLTLDLCGDHQTLNRKLGRLLWLGNTLTEKQISFEIAALTGLGVQRWQVGSGEELSDAMTDLLGCPQATSGSLEADRNWGTRQFHIGGDSDEA